MKNIVADDKSLNSIPHQPILISLSYLCGPQHLPEGHVQNHHHREAQHHAQRRQVGVAAPLGLRHRLLHHHENHGAGGKTQSVGQQGLEDQNRSRADDAGQRLHRAGELPVPETLPAGHARAPQRHGDRQSFGEILNPDPDGERDGGRQGGSGKAAEVAGKVYRGLSRKFLLANEPRTPESVVPPSSQ